MKESGSPEGGLGTTEGLKEDENEAAEGSGEGDDGEGSGDADSGGSGGDGGDPGVLIPDMSTPRRGRSTPEMGLVNKADMMTTPMPKSPGLSGRRSGGNREPKSPRLKGRRSLTSEGKGNGPGDNGESGDKTAKSPQLKGRRSLPGETTPDEDSPSGSEPGKNAAGNERDARDNILGNIQSMMGIDKTATPRPGMCGDGISDEGLINLWYSGNCF